MRTIAKGTRGIVARTSLERFDSSPRWDFFADWNTNDNHPLERLTATLCNTLPCLLRESSCDVLAIISNNADVRVVESKHPRSGEPSQKPGSVTGTISACGRIPMFLDENDYTRRYCVGFNQLSESLTKKNNKKRKRNALLPGGSLGETRVAEARVRLMIYQIKKLINK